MLLYNWPCWMMGKWHGQLQSFAIWKVTLHIRSLWWPVGVSKKFAPDHPNLWCRTPVQKCWWVKWCSFCCGFRCLRTCWHPKICRRHGTRNSLLSVRHSLLEFSWASGHWSLMKKSEHGSEELRGSGWFLDKKRCWSGDGFTDLIQSLFFISPVNCITCVYSLYIAGSQFALIFCVSILSSPFGFGKGLQMSSFWDSTNLV